MSTNAQPQPEVKPAIRGDIVATITPEEIAAAMLRLLAESRKAHTGVTNINLHARIYSDGRTVTDWNGHGINGACIVSCDTLGSALAGLSLQLGDPLALAERKRVEAARLLAEADRLAGKETA